MIQSLKTIFKYNVKEELFVIMRLTNQQFKQYSNTQNHFWLLCLDTSNLIVIELIRKMIDLDILNILVLPDTIIAKLQQLESEKEFRRNICSDNRIKLKRLEFSMDPIYLNKRKPINGRFNLIVDKFFIINNIYKLNDKLATAIVLELNEKSLFTGRVLVGVNKKYESILRMKGMDL